MFKKLLTSKYLYIGLLSVAVFGALVLLLADKVIMPAYTNYNEGITVPDVTRISLTEAESMLGKYGLRYEVTERRANAAYPADYVIDQSPASETIVKPNRKIYLTVNTQIKPKVEVPKVVELSLRNAELQLQNYGLTVGSKSYESSRFKNVVLRQSIPEGSIVDKGSVVDLVVSDGLGERIIEVPEIIGDRLPTAQQKLSEAGFRIGAIQFRPTRDVIPNTVLDYSPKEEQLREGETLDLIISERYEAIEQSEDGAVIIDSTDQQSQEQPADSVNNQPDINN
ncbi:PASTA domain-containing protein [Gracilimonas mengyeensis]|uniref:PASTA domain, binds beta-lactams n=1 Tax=Gracilimonas mengyeensis TaxID=1302730 RepID=A0A521FFE9_9BACT|nr:PASTA domain-containing protein [Gracilimonas mengyeensis]SMO94869.1 PASTA domain, binds beta-lactams [Gracilimonas mengyeensis]